jgi:predicted acyl esterase
MRELDPALSTDFLPVQAFRQARKLSQGEVVPIDVGLIPRAYHFEPGQQLRLTVAGWNVRGAGLDVESLESGPLRMARQAAMTPHADNHGTHIIHSGRDRLSYIKIPVVDSPK